jgi:hypothetical protein
MEALRSLAEEVIADDESSHGFDHGHGARQDARVVTAAAFEGGIFALPVDRFLRGHDGSDRFKGDTKDDGFAIRDAPLDAPGSIGGRADTSLLHAEGVVMFAAGQ